MHVLLQFEYPSYSPSFDWNTERSVPARVQLLETIAAESALLMSPHLPFPGVGHVRSNADGGVSFEPVELPLVKSSPL